MSGGRRATHEAMNLPRWMRPTRPTTTHPILLRLDLGGAPCPSTVEVDAEWLPRRTRASEQLISASAMVLLPWRRDADEAVLSIRAGGRVGRATVTRATSSCVVDVRLDP